MMMTTICRHVACSDTLTFVLLTTKREMRIAGTRRRRTTFDTAAEIERRESVVEEQVRHCGSDGFRLSMHAPSQAQIHDRKIPTLEQLLVRRISSLCTFRELRDQRVSTSPR